MRRVALILVLWCCSLACAAEQSRGDDALKDLVALCYHDVREAAPDAAKPYVIEAAELVNQFAWLAQNGYTPVSLQQVLDAYVGRIALPPKPVLLTFDDGYRSFYTHVYPLLRLYRYPALLALVSRWIEDPQRAGADAPAQTTLLSWDEVRVLARSGLVEIASHSHDLHHGIEGNPQGNALAAAGTRAYDPVTKRYERDADYEQRIRDDLAHSAALIEQRAGVRPRAIVWPYGSYNLTTRRIAREVGMDISLGLDERAPTSRPLGLHLGRTLIVGSPGLRQFIEELLRPYKPDPVRAVRVDLGDVVDADAQRQEAKLSALVERVASLGINTVYLNASADTDGDGRPDSLYFASRQLPLRADLFGRVSWQLHTRAGVRVFAWLPTRGFRKHRSGAGEEPATRADIAEIYQDLARQAPFDGLLFDDPEAADDDADSLAFAQELVRSVALFRAPPLTARAVSPLALLRKGGSDDYTPALQSVAQAYDQVVVRAGAASAASGPRIEAARAVAARLPGRSRVVFEVSGTDPDAAKHLRALQLAGIADLGYARDDFLHDRPALQSVRPVLSLQSAPR